MTIDSFDKEAKREIVSVGKFEKEEDCIKLFTLFGDKKIEDYEISFFNTNILPVEIVEFLINFDKKIKIYTYTKALFLYLNRIGCSNLFIPSKSSYDSKDIKKYDFLAIGGSAESMDKIFKIIKRFPNADKTIFIIQHILQNEKNLLNKLLQKRTEYKIANVKDGMQIEKGTIYIAPAGYHMSIKSNKITLDKNTPINFARPSIDKLFSSLAREYGDKLVAILLCGYGSDGVKSLDALKQYNSMVLIEDPKDCNEAKPLPLNAIRNKIYNYVLNINDMTRFIFALFSNETELDKYIDIFLEDLYEKYWYDLRGYERKSLKRRITQYMIKNNIKSFYQFEEEILHDGNLVEEFLLDFTVNVTSFFRDADIYKILREDILPRFKHKTYLRIWCAGCSSGEEPYSVAMILSELGMLEKSNIYATDINEQVIFQSINGLFPILSLEENKKNYTASGGETSFLDYIEVNKKYIKIKDFLKRKILFFRHSLTNNGVLNEFDIILCRNVMIYFDKNLQAKVFHLFHKSIKSDGFLILEKSAGVIIGESKKYFEKHIEKASVYKPIFNRSI